MASLHVLKRLTQNRLYDRWKILGNHPGFKKYSANAGWMLFARIGTLLISFFVSIYVIRYLGPHNYGLLSYAVSFVSIFAFIASLGIDQILYRELVNHPEKERELLGTALLLKLGGGLLASIITVCVAGFFRSDDANLLLIWIISLAFLFHPWQIIAYTYQARVLSKYPSIITLLISIVLACCKLLVIHFDEGILYFGMILLLEAILYAGFYIIGYARHFGHPLQWKPSRPFAQSLLKDSLPLLFSTVTILIYSRIDQVMIGHYLEVSAVGTYDAAVRLSDVWYVLPNVVIAALFPAILNARKTSQALYAKRVRHLAFLLFCFSALIALPTTFIAGPLVSILYGDAYLASAGVLQIYIWSTIGFSLGSLTNAYLIAENRTLLYLLVSSGTMLLNVALNIILIPLWGTYGAAIATLISYSLIPILPFASRKVRSQLGGVFEETSVIA